MSSDSAASDQLLKWLEGISDSCVDPWPNGGPDSTPVDSKSDPIDPTQHFVEVSDEWTDDEDGSEQVNLLRNNYIKVQI